MNLKKRNGNKMDLGLVSVGGEQQEGAKPNPGDIQHVTIK